MATERCHGCGAALTDAHTLNACYARVVAERDALRVFLQAVRDHGYDAAVEVLGDPDAPAAP